MNNEQSTKNYGNWYLYDGGSSIGKLGSESGKIIDDIENPNGARITIETDTVLAPYTVIVTASGVSGFLCHTHFAGTEEKAREFVLKTKTRIEQLFKHNAMPDEQKDKLWDETQLKLMEEICE